MKHFMSLAPRPFEKIRLGTKTIELRLYDEKRRLLNLGDEIEFTNNKTGEKLVVSVCGLHIFKDFEALYRSLDLLKCGYDSESITSATPRDMEQYYTDEMQKKYGVVGIEILMKIQKGDRQHEKDIRKNI